MHYFKLLIVANKNLNFIKEMYTNVLVVIGKYCDYVNVCFMLEADVIYAQKIQY